MKNIILYIGKFEFPDKNAACHRVINNAECLRDLGYDVRFIGVSYDATESIGEFLNFKINSVLFSKNNIYINNLNYVKRCFQEIFKNDLAKVHSIIFYNFPSLGLRKALKNKSFKRNDIKLVCDITEWHGYRFVRGLDSSLRMHVYNKKMDGLILISEFLSCYYHHQKNSICIPALINYDNSKWPELYLPESNKISFVFAGELAPEKDDFSKFIDCIKSFPYEKYTITVLGCTLDRFLQFYPDEEQFLANNTNIVFNAKTSHSRCLDIISKSDFGLIIREKSRKSQAGFPTKLGEMMRCGTPSISTNVSDISKYISNGVNGFIIDSMEDIRKCLESIFSLSRKEINEMKTRCFADRSLDYRNFTYLFEKMFPRIISRGNTDE